MSGVVKDQEGNEISGAEITFESKIMDYEPEITDEQGKWEKSGLKGQVKIVPAYKNYAIYPESVDVNDQQDIVFTVSIGYYYASGIITDEAETTPLPELQLLLKPSLDSLIQP